jgi:putative SOS response-associated peptidase YedK
MLYAAGLWEPKHHLQEDDSDGSVTVITHDAVELAGTVHDRMPVFMEPGIAHEWMSAGSDDAMNMLLSATMPALRIVRVSRAINSSRNRGGPESIEPAVE